MAWLTTRTIEYKIQQRACWHFWFAWHPVTVKNFSDGARKRIWWRYVLRKGEYQNYPGDNYWIYEYKD